MHRRLFSNPLRAAEDAAAAVAAGDLNAVANAGNLNMQLLILRLCSGVLFLPLAGMLTSECSCEQCARARVLTRLAQAACTAAVAMAPSAADSSTWRLR